MLKKQCKQWMESQLNIQQIIFFLILFIRSIDNSRVGVSFARKRTIGGRRGGSYNNGGGGGDRYPRGDYDSSRNRRRYSPRQSDDMRDRYV